MNNLLQGTLQLMEVGKGTVVIRLVPLIIVVGAIIILSDFGSMQTPFFSLGGVYRGLSDPQSMDNAQLARQIVRGRGFTTEFLRPHALAQLRDYAVSEGLRSGKPHDLFPSDEFPPGTPRILPDTYNAPGYPYLLAGWFLLIHPEFDQTAVGIQNAAIYSPDRWIPLLNQIFLVLTAGLVFVLGRRLFDERVAWMALVSFLVTDLVWKYSLSALSTSFLMFLTTAALYCVQEIFRVGEACFDSEENSFFPAWLWAVPLALLLAAVSLTRLPLVVLVVPVMVLLLVMPSARLALGLVVTAVVLAAVAPWYIHLDRVSGSYLGSNAPQMLRGFGDYKGNEIYCTAAIPSYEQLFANATKKECYGFLWNFERFWSLLGSNPMILMFAASILHQFKRRRSRLFHWLVFGSALAILFANNLGSKDPEAFDPWNSLILLFPAMVVVGSAFFFIMLDRLNLQLWLLNNLIVIVTLLFSALALGTTLTTSSFFAFNFPPYWPPTIKTVAQLAQPDEWVTTDMPWATAWYGDRASLWLPDSVSDFENFHDNVCATGILLITPVTWEAPMSNVTTGEDKDWFPIVTGAGVPPNFPLQEHYTTRGKVPAYALWSDRPRWQSR